MAVICKFSSKIVGHHFDAPKQRVDVGIGDGHPGEEGDVRERVVRWVEPDLGAGRVPVGLELFLEGSSARGAEVEDKGSSYEFVQVRVVDVSNEPVGGNLEKQQLNC